MTTSVQTQSVVQVYFDAYSRDPKVQIRALVIIRRAKIAELEKARPLSPRGRRRLYQHRRMLRSYEADALRLGVQV